MSDARHFEGCPVCGDDDGYVNNYSHHWLVCDTHKRRWYVGSNLFSSWHDEAEEDWVRARKLLSEYEGPPMCEEPAPTSVTFRTIDGVEPPF